MEPDASCPEDVRPKVLAGEACWAADGPYINSQNDTLCLNGLNKKQGIAKVIEWLEANKIGKATVNYKLRDWLFSRQRYWGEPFPVIHWEDGEISTVDASFPPRISLILRSSFRTRTVSLNQNTLKYCISRNATPKTRALSIV